MICMKKKIDFLIAREQKLGARGHWALLEHSPVKTANLISINKLLSNLQNTIFVYFFIVINNNKLK